MSKLNKVNKDRYTQRGRLTPDELARERARQIHLGSAQRRFNERSKQAAERRAEQAPTPERNEPAEEE
jgi:hypothetical protein